MRWEDQDIDENLFSCAVGVSGEPLVTNEIKGALIDMADNETKVLVSTDSNDAREYFFAGTFLDQVGMFGEAEKLLERAHDLSPARQKIAFELAANYLYQKRNNDAVAILKQAYESAPQYTKAASAYAVALMIDGREDDARKISGVDAALLDRVASYISAGKNYLKPVIAYQGVIVDQSDFVSLIQQSRREYAAGMNDQAVKTLQIIESTFPEYRDLMENAIKQIQEHPAP